MLYGPVSGSTKGTRIQDALWACVGVHKEDTDTRCFLWACVGVHKRNTDTRCFMGLCRGPQTEHGYKMLYGPVSGPTNGTRIQDALWACVGVHKRNTDTRCFMGLCRGPQTEHGYKMHYGPVSGSTNGTHRARCYTDIGLALNLYSGDTRFESQPEYHLS
jgi:hypothetical protein